MKISLIVAMASNRVIGANNKMPWHLPADLKRFRQITWDAPIIMGRNTHESIGKPLPGRANIIITRNLGYQAPGCTVCHDPQSAKELACQTADEIFIIGGAKLYQTFLPCADTLYMTKINKAFSGDTRFPLWPEHDWHELERDDVFADPAVDFDYSFMKYTRKAR